MEVDVIQDALTYVFDAKSPDVINEGTLTGNNPWNSDILYEGCSDRLIWSSDSFAKTCSRVARRSRKNDEKLQAPVTADILACLKFENGTTETQSDKNQRRLQFSTGYSISVENLFPSDDVSENDCDLFLNDSENVLEFEEFFNYLQGNQVQHPIQYRDDLNPDGRCTNYSNPFDPNIQFNGFTDIFEPSDTGTSLDEDGSNFLLAIDDSTSRFNDYLHDYRKYVRNLSNEIHHVTRTSGQARFEDLERIARREISDIESDPLVSKLYAARHLWENCDISDQNVGDDKSTSTEHVTPMMNFTVGISCDDNTNMQINLESPDEQQYWDQVESHAVAGLSPVQNAGLYPALLDTQSDLANEIKKYKTSEIDCGSDEVSTIDDIVQKFSRKYVNQNYTERDIRQILVSLLNDRTRPQTHEERSSIDCLETDAVTTGNSCNGEIGLLYSSVESDPAEVGASSINNLEDIQHSGIIQPNLQPPSTVHPHGSSGFWGNSDIDQTILNNTLQSQLTQHADEASCHTHSVFHSKDHPVHNIQYPQQQFLHPAPVIQPQMVSGHNQHTFTQTQPQSQPLIYQGSRESSSWNNHIGQNTYSQPYTYHVPRPSLVPANFQVPPPFFQHNHNSSLSHHQIRPLFQLEISNCINQEVNHFPDRIGDTKDCFPTWSTATNSLQFKYPENQINRNVHESQNAQNYSDGQTFLAGSNVKKNNNHTMSNQAEPTFVLPNTQPKTHPPRFNLYNTKSSANNRVNPLIAETRLVHHNDPNFRLDDEIWYINGIPHRHARPVHNLHSSTTFYPTSQHNPNMNAHSNSGINRRIAEQVARINQTYNDSSQGAGTPFQNNGNVKFAHSNINKGHCQTNNPLTVYPVYSDPAMANRNIVYSRQVNQGDGMFSYSSNVNNNNNGELSENIADCIIQNDLHANDMLNPDEEITCFDELGYNTVFENLDTDVKNVTISSGILKTDNCDKRREVNDNGLDSELISLCSWTGDMQSYDVNAHYRDNGVPSWFSDTSSDCDSERQSVSSGDVSGSPSNEFVSDQDCGYVRHIRVLGRNRHQKENERAVKKRREINRNVLVQLV